MITTTPYISVRTNRPKMSWIKPKKATPKSVQNNRGSFSGIGTPKMETYEEFVREAVKKYPQPSLRPPGGVREGFEESNSDSPQPGKSGHTNRSKIRAS